MERKTVRFETKDINEEEGTFTGYASTFTTRPDSYGDVVDKGAFKKTLKENRSRIKILWNHFTMEPIGLPVELHEDETGLLVKGKLSLGVQRAREVLSLMKDGVINEMSIGFDTITESFEKVGKATIRHLKEVKLWDVSPVTYAANPTAQIIDVKAAELAISRNDVKSIEESLKSLQALIESIKGGTEPGETTPETQDDNEAAELERLLDTIDTDIDGGLDEQEAAALLESAINNYGG
jgi:hypothetical protein